MIYAFGDFELDMTNYELRASGVCLPIEPIAFDVLAYLVVHHDRMVMKEELLEQVWHKLSVSDGTISRCLSSVRKAIGDLDHKNRLIVQLCAILGREFPYQLLKAIVPMDEQDLKIILAQLVQAEFLFQLDVEPHRSYRFKHILIQEVAYQSLLNQARLHYHKLWGQV